jgi:LuxR family transcriptional regulator, maltose regulon positive regulatory protein
MSSAGRPGTAYSTVAPVTGGIVPRRDLLERLAAAARITLVSGPAGSGKTLLLRSWVAESKMAERAAWVPVQGTERDPERFWLSLADALRGTKAGRRSCAR